MIFDTLTPSVLYTEGSVVYAAAVSRLALSDQRNVAPKVNTSYRVQPARHALPHSMH